jgi:hypothetical protein
MLVYFGAHVGQEGQRRIILSPLDGEEDVGEAGGLQRLLTQATELQAAHASVAGAASVAVAACLSLDISQNSEVGAGKLLGAVQALLLRPRRVCLGCSTKGADAVAEDI